MRPSEREIRAAAVQAAIQIAEEIPVVLEYTFSPLFLQKMKEMIDLRKRRIESLQQIKRMKIAVVSFIATAFLLLYANPNVRAVITDWIREKVDDVYHYFVSNENPDEPPSSYQPTWIPEGYELLICESIPSSTTYLYQIESGELTDFITITYTQKEPDVALNIIPLEENYTITQKIICGKYMADLYIAGDNADCNTLVWFEPKYNIAFIISSYLNEDDILKIAENLVPVY